MARHRRHDVWKDYQWAIYKHFKVQSKQELEASKQWQAFAAKANLSKLRGYESWKLAYEMLSQFENTTNSAKSGIIRTAHHRTRSTASPTKQEFQQIKVIAKRDWVPPFSESTTSTPDKISSFIELHDHQGQTVGALLEYSAEQSKQLTDHFKQQKFHSLQPWHQGSISNVVVDQLGASSAAISTGLQVGKLYRVIGPPELVKGISSGAYRMIQTDTGAIGTVTNTVTGRIAGHLRFANAAALPVVAPILAYQVLHCIVGTRELNQINQRLAHLEAAFDKLYRRQEAEIFGKIHYAISVLDDVLQERFNTGNFTAGMTQRLAQAEEHIVSLRERNRILVEQFRYQAEAVKNQRRKQGARSAASLLRSEGKQVLQDMQCLVGLMAAELQLEQAWLLAAMQNNPTDVGRRQEQLRQRMQEHQQTLKNLPSIQELKHHAQACLHAMKWWERMCDFRQTQKEVQKTQNKDFDDISFPTEQLQPSLSGYIFWRDDEGTHVFSMSGEDLKLWPNHPMQELVIREALSPGQTYQLRLPDSSVVKALIESEMETDHWIGRYSEQSEIRTVVIRRESIKE